MQWVSPLRGLFCVLKTLPPHTVGARSQNDETEGETRWTSITALFGLCLHGWRGL